MRKRVVGLALAALAAVVAGCAEDLESGGACPALCPEQNIPVRELVISAIAEGDTLLRDTSVSNFPLPGTEPFLLLARRGDTLVTVGVIRFDVLPDTFRKGTADSAIARVDSAALRLFLSSTGRVVKAPVTVEVYDVAGAAPPDTAVAPILARFAPENLLAAVTFPPSAFSDTASLLIPLPDSLVLARIQADEPLRFGLRVTSDSSVQIRVRTREIGQPAQLRFRATPDTAAAPIVVLPSSTAPAEEPVLARDFTDYLIPVVPMPRPDDTVLAVGGIPGRRAYFRFDLPDSILVGDTVVRLDDATIIRATLELTQKPNEGVGTGSPLVIYPQVVTAGARITDPERAAHLTLPFSAAPGVVSSQALGIDSLVVLPSDGGVVRIELVRLLRRWLAQDPADVPHALVLRSAFEGTLPLEALFYAREAPPELQPRLRITYIPRVGIGLP